MKYNPGDTVVVVDPTPYLNDRNCTNGLYFNDRMRVFIGRTFVVSRIASSTSSTYRLEYINELDREETDDDVVSRWIWKEVWLMAAEGSDPNEIDISNLPDIMSFIGG